MTWTQIDTRSSGSGGGDFYNLKVVVNSDRTVQFFQDNVLGYSISFDSFGFDFANYEYRLDITHFGKFMGSYYVNEKTVFPYTLYSGAAIYGANGSNTATWYYQPLVSPSVSPSNPIGSSSNPTVVSNPPTLSWNYSDINATDNEQSAYQVIIYNNAGGVVIDTGKVLSSTKSYNTPTLSGGIYSWIVRAWDSDDKISAFTTNQYFKINTVPNPPTVTSPNGGETWNGTHTLTWNAGSDPDGDVLGYDIELTLDNGTSWKRIGSFISGTSFNYDFTNEPETSTAKIRVRTSDNIATSVWDESNGIFAIRHNVTPSTPTNLSPNNSSVNRAITNRLTWQHNDSFSDPQAKFDLQWRLQGNVTWNVVTMITNSQLWDAPPNTFPLGTIEWRVKTYDQGGLNSPYSNTVTFLASDKPSSPTITYPGNNSIVPIANPTIQWSSYSQTSYHLKVLSSTDVLLWESIKTSTTNAETIGYNLANNTNYKIELAVQNTDGLWSDFAVSNISVSYTPPNVPDITVFTDMDNIIPSVTIVINPFDTETTNIYRRKLGETEWKMIASGIVSEYEDYSCPYGEYEYSAISIGSNGTQSLRSPIQYVKLLFEGWWVVDLETNNTFQFYYNVPFAQINIEEERSEIKTFSSKPFIRYGAYKVNRGSLNGLKINNNESSAREQVFNLLSMIDKRKPLLLKNDLGDIWTVNLYNPTRKYFWEESQEVSVEWVEV